MKIFIDTNVFLEYLCGRKKASEVSLLLDAIEDGGHEAFLSSSCLCTISYYVELTLKEHGIHKPHKTEKDREILNGVLEIATLADINHECADIAINDTLFSDFEDSMQYRCALKAGCNLLVTFNIKDFQNIDGTKIKILTPQEAYTLLSDFQQHTLTP